MAIEIDIIPVLKDNYAYLLKVNNGETAVVDPGEAGPVIAELEQQDLSLDYILNTHHHGDHIAGNAALIEKYGAKLVGPAKEKMRIQNMDILLNEGDIFSFGDEDVQILETPGHTTGGICFYFPDSKSIFTGDTLFLMSTGRLFEGTPEQMWESLQKIMVLPDDTRIYCGHEYTLDNGEFCLSIEPGNKDLQKRVEHVRALREKNQPTMPGTIKEEKQTNAFLRAGSAKGYAQIRKMKDTA